VTNLTPRLVLQKEAAGGVNDADGLECGLRRRHEKLCAMLQIQPVAKATKHAHEPLQKKSKNEMDEQTSLGSAAKPQRARMGQGARC
jgi:hypothetical protein